MISKNAKANVMRLVEFMESLPRSANKHFDMTAYLHHGDEHAHGVPEKPADILTCGTTACAMGWMATMPYFRRKGLHLSISKERAAGEIWIHLGKRVTDYSDVAERLMGLDYVQSLDLFAGTHKDKTPKAWAKRVRGLVRQWEKEQSR